MVIRIYTTEGDIETVWEKRERIKWKESVITKRPLRTVFRIYSPRGHCTFSWDFYKHGPELSEVYILWCYYAQTVPFIRSCACYLRAHNHRNRFQRLGLPINFACKANCTAIFVTEVSNCKYKVNMPLWSLLCEQAEAYWWSQWVVVSRCVSYPSVRGQLWKSELRPNPFWLMCKLWRSEDSVKS